MLRCGFTYNHQYQHGKRFVHDRYNGKHLAKCTLVGLQLHLPVSCMAWVKLRKLHITVMVHMRSKYPKVNTSKIFSFYTKK